MRSNSNLYISNKILANISVFKYCYDKRSMMKIKVSHVVSAKKDNSCCNHLTMETINNHWQVYDI